MTQSFISQNLAGGGVKIYRLITEPVTFTIKDNAQKLHLPMELKSTDSLLMEYTIGKVSLNNVNGLTCYTTQRNTAILPLQGVDVLKNMGKLIIPMFSGTEKKFIGIQYYPHDFDFVFMQYGSDSTGIPFIIHELYLLR